MDTAISHPDPDLDAVLLNGRLTKWQVCSGFVAGLTITTETTTITKTRFGRVEEDTTIFHNTTFTLMMSDGSCIPYCFLGKDPGITNGTRVTLLGLEVHELQFPRNLPYPWEFVLEVIGAKESHRGQNEGQHRKVAWILRLNHDANRFIHPDENLLRTTGAYGACPRLAAWLGALLGLCISVYFRFDTVEGIITVFAASAVSFIAAYLHMERIIREDWNKQVYPVIVTFLRKHIADLRVIE